jgi:glycosyltransferase involved in cell wall biosynthesis
VRILHLVAEARRRGAEMFAADLIGVLAERGVDQHVAFVRDEAHEVRFAVPTSTLDSSGWRVPGLRVDLGSVRSLRRLIGSWAPDVVQVHGGEPLKHAVLAAGGTVPVVYRRIGPAVPRISRGPRRAAYGRLMRQASRVVAVADSLRQETIDLFGVPAERVVTIPNAIDPRRMDPVRGRVAARSDLGIPPDARVLLSLGSLTEEKDPLVHLEITERLGRDGIEVVHLLVGDGPLRPDIEAAVRRNGLARRVLLLGVRDDVPDLLAASDVVLLASRSEGLPGCVIEAGMAGVPAASYGLPGVSEAVEQGVTGLLASPGDTDELTRCVRTLVTEDGRRAAMGTAARDRYRSRYDVRTVAPRYEEVYREASR